MGEIASPDTPWFICLGCNNFFSNESAPNPVYVGEYVFCSIECQQQRSPLHAREGDPSPSPAD